MGVDRAPLGDHQALGGHGLDTDIVGPGRDRALDRGGQQILEHGEEAVLQRDLERQKPVEEGGDRRQVFSQRAVAANNLETSRLLEGLERAALDLAGVKQLVELAQWPASFEPIQLL
jgi:hypothetical protein